MTGGVYKQVREKYTGVISNQTAPPASGQVCSSTTKPQNRCWRASFVQVPVQQANPHSHFPGVIQSNLVKVGLHRLLDLSVSHVLRQPDHGAIWACHQQLLARCWRLQHGCAVDAGQDLHTRAQTTAGTGYYQAAVTLEGGMPHMLCCSPGLSSCRNS